MKNIKTFEKYLKIYEPDASEMKLNLGDEILSGKFKNKKIKVKTINTINGKPFNKMRTIKKED